jgi:tetratricopeptide (TPR) repeat protein
MFYRVPVPVRVCACLLVVGVFLFNFQAAAKTIHVTAGWNVTAAKYVSQGSASVEKGDYENARQNFDAAIRAEPDLWVAYYDRAALFAAQKKWALAREDVDKAIRLKPTFLLSTVLRVDVNVGARNYAAALADLDRLVDLMRVRFDRWIYRVALNHRAWLRATCGNPSIRNGPIAVADAKKACDADRGENAEYVDTLAAAYAEAGDFTSAVATEEKAIQMSKSATEVKQYSSRLELYKQHRPYRDG